MNGNDWKRGMPLKVSAVLAHLEIPAGLLARMHPRDRIEIETEDAALIVWFEILDNIVARAHITERAGRLIATIGWTGCQPGARRFDPWTIKHEERPDQPDKGGGGNEGERSSAM
jgi:hypothetical protein